MGTVTSLVFHGNGHPMVPILETIVYNLNTDWGNQFSIREIRFIENIIDPLFAASSVKDDEDRLANRAYHRPILVALKSQEYGYDFRLQLLGREALEALEHWLEARVAHLASECSAEWSTDDLWRFTKAAELLALLVLVPADIEHLPEPR